MADISSWFSEKFLDPLCRYYTLENTIAYAVIFLVAIYGVYKLLQRLKIRIDKHFFFGILPFIIYGGWTRALRDHGLYTGWQFCSPPIYFVMFAIVLSSLLLGLFLQKKFKIPYYKTMAAIGIILLLYNASITSISNYTAFFAILALAGFWLLLLLGANRLRPKLVSRENALITAAHLLDASASFMAIQFFGYYEQHVLPGFLIGIGGPWVLFPLKIAVVLPILIWIDRGEEDAFFRKFLKVIILILGLGLGIRDFLTVSMLNV